MDRICSAENIRFGYLQFPHAIPQTIRILSPSTRQIRAIFLSPLTPSFWVTRNSISMHQHAHLITQGTNTFHLGQLQHSRATGKIVPPAGFELEGSLCKMAGLHSPTQERPGLSPETHTHTHPAHAKGEEATKINRRLGQTNPCGLLSNWQNRKEAAGSKLHRAATQFKIEIRDTQPSAVLGTRCVEVGWTTVGFRC